MPQLCMFLRAHLPRQLSEQPTLTNAFANDAERERLRKYYREVLQPVNNFVHRLIRETDDVRLCLSISGPLLIQARQYLPTLLDDFTALAELGHRQGRLELVAEPHYHSLSSMFADGNKAEFKQQLDLHQQQLAKLSGVQSQTVSNSELIYSNTVAAVVGSLGYANVICEGVPDMSRADSKIGVYVDPLQRVRVMPRQRQASQMFLQLLKQRSTAVTNVTAAMAEISLQRLLLLGMRYEELAAATLEPYFWQECLNRLLANSINNYYLPSRLNGECANAPVASVGDEHATCWNQPQNATAVFLQTPTQRQLFERYQELEDRVKASGDANILHVWRHLGDCQFYADMLPQTHDGSVNDACATVMNYSSLLSELRADMNGGRRFARVRRKLRRPRILLVTPEVTELPPGIGNLANFVTAKGGGLADISAALVAQLLGLGLDIHIAVPKYERRMRETAQISQADLDRLVTMFRSSDSIHLAHDSSFSHVQDVYEDAGMNTALHRALAFQRSVINQLIRDAMPEHGKMLIHCNDWMTGLIPAAARSLGLPSLFTVHNIFTEGDTLRNLENYGIDVSRFAHDLYLREHPDHLANAWEQASVDFLLSGIKAADHVNTVSPTFLLEIVNGYFPDLVSWQLRHELSSKYNAGCASGILNAPKRNEDPRFACGLQQSYDQHSFVEGKRANKVTFQKAMGLIVDADAPLFFWPHRLFEQKGPWLLAEIALSLVNHYHSNGLQIALVGNGSANWEQAFGSISCGSNGRISLQRFNSDLSELGKAAADFILMPSLYEPCGLPQMEGMRFGTLPIVRATGGLKDTVQHLDLERETGNGFVFDDFAPDALWWACTEAMRFYNADTAKKQRIIAKVMQHGVEGFNLEKTTMQYVRIYERLLGEKLV